MKTMWLVTDKCGFGLEDIWSAEIRRLLLFPLFFYPLPSLKCYENRYPLSRAFQSETIAVGYQSLIPVLMRIWPRFHPAVGRLEPGGWKDWREAELNNPGLSWQGF